MIRRSWPRGATHSVYFSPMVRDVAGHGRRDAITKDLTRTVTMLATDETMPRCAASAAMRPASSANTPKVCK